MFNFKGPAHISFFRAEWGLVARWQSGQSFALLWLLTAFSRCVEQVIQMRWHLYLLFFHVLGYKAQKGERRSFINLLILYSRVTADCSVGSYQTLVDEVQTWSDYASPQHKLVQTCSQQRTPSSDSPVSVSDGSSFKWWADMKWSFRSGPVPHVSHHLDLAKYNYQCLSIHVNGRSLKKPWVWHEWPSLGHDVSPVDFRLVSSAAATKCASKLADIVVLDHCHLFGDSSFTNQTASCWHSQAISGKTPW